MSARLTDKNLKALGEGAVDDDLGIALPSGVGQQAVQDVKQEVPSLDALQKQYKSSKNPY